MNQTNIYLFPLFFKTFLFLWWLGLIFLSFWGFDNNPCAGILRGCVKSKSKKNLVEDCILDFFDGKIIIFTFARGSNFHLKYGYGSLTIWEDTIILAYWEAGARRREKPIFPWVDFQFLFFHFTELHIFGPDVFWFCLAITGKWAIHKQTKKGAER